MPMPVRRPGGAFVVPVGDWLVRVSTWVDLLPPDTGLDPAVVGRLLAALHQVDYAPPAGVLETGVDPWYAAPVGEPVWSDLTARLEALGAPFAATFRAELPNLLALEDLFEEPRDLRMCHCDLWADNVLRTSVGGAVRDRLGQLRAGRPGPRAGAVRFSSTARGDPSGCGRCTTPTGQRVDRLGSSGRVSSRC